MANDLNSNFTRPLAEIFLKSFESARIISKNVDTQLLEGRFQANSGDTVDVKRPHDYKTIRTSSGDVSAATKSDIIAGKASATVQDYFTVLVDYSEAEEAIELAQLGKPGQAQSILGPMTTRAVVDMELDFAAFALKNCGLMAGTYGTSATTWDHIAEWGSMLDASGVPKDMMWRAFINPFTERRLASNQRSLGAGGAAGSDIKSAHEMATLTENFAGLNVMKANTLSSLTTHSAADRVGAVNGTPTATYLGAKDTMTQQITVDGFGANLEVRAGEVLEVTTPVAGNVNRLNLSTRQQIVDDTGANIKFTGTVTEAVTLNGSGAGTLTVTGPAIFEANGAYNTVSQAIADNDVVTLLGSASTLYQPNMFWHPQAFTIASVPMKKLYSTDTIATTEDGLQFRVSYGTGFLENEQKVRIDMRPAYGVLNPFFAGQGWGS